MLGLAVARLAEALLARPDSNPTTPRGGPLRWLPGRRQQRAASESKSTATSSVTTAGMTAMIGLALYIGGREAWRRGPLRGGLSVFGASPQLDRCASQERYLAEKLAELSHAALGGSATLARLSQIRVDDAAVSGVVGSVTSYAKHIRSVGGAVVAPEVGQAWAVFAARVGAHQQEMRSLADKLYYPVVPGVDVAKAHAGLMVLNITEPIRRFARSSGDCAEVLSWLLKELGSSAASQAWAALGAFSVGVCIGSELERYVPDDVGRHMRRLALR